MFEPHHKRSVLRVVAACCGGFVLMSGALALALVPAVRQLTHVSVQASQALSPGPGIRLAKEPLAESPPVQLVSTSPRAVSTEKAGQLLTQRSGPERPELEQQPVPEPELTFTVLEPSFDAPRCDDVFVYVVTAFDDPSANVATMAAGTRTRGRARRIGARVGDHKVIAIGENPDRQSAAVWLARNGEVCQALLRDDNPVREEQVRRDRQKAARKYKARQRKLAAKERKAAKKRKKRAAKKRKRAAQKRRQRAKRRRRLKRRKNR